MPFFLGMIVGESIACEVWLIVAIVLSQAGIEYHAIRLTPW